MAKTGFECVREFHQTFEHPIAQTPSVPETKIGKLRLNLILEEFIELVEACLDTETPTSRAVIDHLSKVEQAIRQLHEDDFDVDVIAVADALTDINYVTYGAGHCYGVDLDACMQEVQRSNMSKLGEDGRPIYDEHGKVMKGPNYSPPDLRKVLNQS